MSVVATLLSIALLLAVVFLIKLIANTAANFFSPTLQHFTEVTYLPDHLGKIIHNL